MAEIKSDPIRFGILGCADIARKLTRAICLAPNSAVVAVGSRSIDKARRFIADNGLSAAAVRAHGSYEDVLGDDGVDAIYIPLPTSLHVRWAVAAAERRKHVLLEKPTAVCVADLDRILEACRRNRVQFMDGTMWMHHPRTAKIKELLSDPDRFGKLKWVNATFAFPAPPEFLKNDIRVKPDLDALGALGDAGWYCIRAILWVADYELPRTVAAFPAVEKNEAGVILACGASLVWDDGKGATFHCSFLAQMNMELSAAGTRGVLQLSDFVGPYDAKSAHFAFRSEPGFLEMQAGWRPPERHVVEAALPQEALMVEEFARLATRVRDSGGAEEETWPTITRKTQLVVDAVKASIEKGFSQVEVVW